MALSGAVMLGTIGALTLCGMALANPVSANVHTSGVLNHHSGAAHSEVIENDGSLVGMCAYVNSDGNMATIKYKKSPDGELVAETDVPNVDPYKALEECKRAGKAAALAAQRSVQQVEEMIRQQQQQLQAMQQKLFANFQNFQIPAFGYF